MKDWLNSIRSVPKITRVAINQGKNVTGSFIDPEWVLHYIAEGDWEFELEAKSYRIAKGDLVLIPPRLLHIVRPKSGKKLVQLVVHFNLFEGPFRQGDFPFVVTSGNKKRPMIRELFNALKSEWDKRDAMGALAASGYLLAFLAVYGESIHFTKSSQPREGVHWGNIEMAIRYIQENFKNKDLDLGLISRAARLSPNYLCRVFKNCFGIPVMKYVTAYRIQKAEELLLNSTMNCSEIAEIIGFEGIHIFSRLFRKYKNVPPTSYRGAHRESSSKSFQP